MNIFFVRARCVFILAALWGAMASGRASAQAILPPPFGLQWGDTPDKILDWAQAQKLHINIFMPGDRPEIRDIKVTAVKGSLPGNKAFALEARYHWGKLYEVTVRYGAPNIQALVLRRDFDQMKKTLTTRHGKFKQNGKSKKLLDGLIHKKESYHVEPVAGLMLLIAWSEMEDPVKKKKSARFHLLYSNQNIIPKK